MKALFYKGEDIILTFMSETDMSGFTKVVKFFTFGSAVKTATLTPVDNYAFKAKLSKTDTADLKTGRLNVVIEMTNYSFVEVGADVFVFLDYHGTLNDSIIPEPEWIGKKINVYEKNSKCTLIGDVVTGAIEIASTASPTDYGYIVLKIS